MTKKSLIGAITLGAALISGANAHADTNEGYFVRTADNIMATNYLQEINQNSKTSIDSILGRGQGSVYAVDPTIGLMNILKWLNSDEAKNFYGNRLDLIKTRYQSFLSEINKEQRTENYGKSLARLNKALEDGVLNPSELQGIEGTYMIIKKGGGWSVPALVKIEKNYDTTSKKRTTYPDLVKKKLEKIGEKDSKEKLQKDEGLHLILGLNVDTDFNNFGGAIGLKYDPVKDLSFSILANFSKAEDENIYHIKTPEFKGIYGEINKDEINSFSIGPSLEFQAGPLFFGGGFNYWNWIEKTEEKIMKGAEVKKSSINSIPNSKIFENMYAGLEFKFKNFGLGASVGYDGKKGPYVGARTTIRLNKPKRESKK
ncbi:hypothetical protein KAT24_02455 [Candidatus Pacearchaeota archaeon]|nr:hypothetical protein [Candidatus Pacearchaeota archaeon]